MRILTAAALAVIASSTAAAPRVVTDIAPVHSLAAIVMAGVGEPALLVPPEATPHGYAMRPSEAAALQNAEIVLWVGEELTPWLERSIASLAADAVQVELLATQGLTRFEFRKAAIFGDEHGGHGDHHDNHDDHAAEGDDHKDAHHDEHEHGHKDEHDDHDDHADHKHEAGHDDHPDGHDSDDHSGHDDHDRHDHRYVDYWDRDGCVQRIAIGQWYDRHAERRCLRRGCQQYCGYGGDHRCDRSGSPETDRRIWDHQELIASFDLQAVRGVLAYGHTPQ